MPTFYVALVSIIVGFALGVLMMALLAISARSDESSQLEEAHHLIASCLNDIRDLDARMRAYLIAPTTHYRDLMVSLEKKLSDFPTNG